nr:MAG TPA: hypothetical protein [Caudoviricetes sp.]
MCAICLRRIYLRCACLQSGVSQSAYCGRHVANRKNDEIRRRFPFGNAAGEVASIKIMGFKGSQWGYI